MPAETQELRSITQTSRPLKYVFIVDPDSPDISKQLHEIFQFSITMWGGRLNVIIPLIKGEIGQSWWKIFKICDPDKVVACTPLSNELIHKIYKDICPSEISVANVHNPILAPRQTPVGIFEIPKHQENNASYGKRKKYYYIKSNREPSQIDQKFIEINFGCYLDHSLLNESLKNVMSKEVLILTELNAQSFINNISSQYDEEHVFPIDLCMTYTSKPYQPEHDIFSSSLQIIVGNSSLDLIYFWNRHMYTNGHNGRDTVLIPPELLQDNNFVEKIGKWINSNYYGGNNGVGSVYAVSFSIENLEESAKKLKSSFPSLGIRTKKLSYHSIPLLKVYHKESMNDISDFLISTNRVIVENGTSILPIRKPPFHYLSNSRFTNVFFAVDLKIEHKPKQFANKTEFIRVPQRYGHSYSFFGYPPIISHINSLGYPSIVVETDNNFIKLSIPNIMNILNEYRFDIPRVLKLVPDNKSESKFQFEDSEEGKSLKRLIELFGDLNSLGGFLEDPFLAKFSYQLSNIKNLNDEIRHKHTKLKHAVITLAKIISPNNPVSDNQADICVEILDEKLNVFFNKPNNEYSLCQIEKLFGSLKNEAVKKGNDVNFWQAFKNFNDFHREQFNFYYQKKIFLQGFRQTCPFCLHEDWYPIPNNGNIQCNSCSSLYHLEIFPEFKIRINDLLARALKKNSYIHVAWALYHLQRDSYQSSFFHLHSQDLIPKGEQQELTDLDFIVIKNGKFGIGEVKANPGLFLKNQTLEKLELAVNLVLPDEVYLVAPSKEQWSEEVIHEINKFKEKMDDLGIATILYKIPPLVEWSDGKLNKKT